VLTITLDVNDEVIGRVHVRNLGPTDRAEAADPLGVRRYRVWAEGVSLPGVEREVTHRRADGAIELARAALEAVAPRGLVAGAIEQLDRHITDDRARSVQ